MNNGQGNWSELLKSLRLLHIGWIMAGSIVLCTLGGFWLDRRWGSAPAFMIAGFVLGLVSGAWSCYRLLWREMKKDLYPSGPEADDDTNEEETK